MKPYGSPPPPPPTSQQQQYQSQSQQPQQHRVYYAPPAGNAQGGAPHYYQQQGYAAAPQYGQWQPAPQRACQLTRNQLDQYLQQSGYGSNAAMFNCYFTRAEPNGPPLCINCRQPVAAHPSDAVTNPVVTLGQASVGVPFGSEPTLPSGLVKGTDGFDTVIVQPNWGLVMAIGIMVAVGTIMIIAFSASGMIAMAPTALIGPCVVVLVAIALSFMLVRHTTRIETSEFKPAPQRAIRTEARRIIWFCCGTTSHETTWGAIQRIECEATNTRVNRQTIYRVVAQCDRGAEIVLYQGYYVEADREANNWRHYFRDARAQAPSW